MRKIIALAAVIVAGTLAGQAQGVIKNSNYSFDIGSEQPVYLSDGATPVTGSSYVAQIWSGGAALSNPAPFLDAGLGFDGAWNADPSEYSDGVAVPGVAAGADATVQVAVWDAGTYASLADAQASGAGDAWGISSEFTVTLGSPATDGPPPSPAVPANMVNFTSFSLMPVIPEPTTIALGLMGLGLVALRARKK